MRLDLGKFAATRFALMMALTAFPVLVAEAAVPLLIDYQGYLTSSPSGVPLNATVPIVFKLYKADNTEVYNETQTITVTSGVFNAVIGSVNPLLVPFDQPYFLGIKVGPDPEMVPRQPLNSTPYALRGAIADSLAATAMVAGSQIAGAITSGTLPATNLTGTIGTAQIATNAVTQAKLSPVAGAASGKVLGTDGTNLQWQTPGAGTVTSVTATAGGGLATSPAGGITGAGSIGIAAGGIQTAMIADGAITAVKVAASQQLPSCVVGQVARWTGSGWGCGNLAPIMSTYYAPEMAATGSLSMAIPADERPIIFFAASTVHAMKCNGPECYGTANVVNFMAAPAGYTSVAIGTDGLPIVAAYIDEIGNPYLVFLKCSDPVCTNAGNYRHIGLSVGAYVSLASASDGLPLMAYYRNDLGGKVMAVTKCSIADCSAFTSIPIDSTNTNLGRYTSLRIGADGIPVISYRDDLNTSLKVAKCNNASCDNGAVLTFVDNTGDVGEYTSLVIGLDGKPVISYYDTGNGDLKVAKCANAACTGSATITTIDSSGNVGTYTSITLSSDGFPVIAYRDETNKALKVAKCINAACTGTAIINVLDNTGDVGQSPTIAVRSDGMPVISYLDATNSRVKFAKCTNVVCQRP